MTTREKIIKFLTDIEEDIGPIPKFAHNLNTPDDRVYYSGPVFDKNEVAAAVEALINGKWLATGEKVRRFERLFSKHIDKKHTVMVNSGSSANLVMIGAVKKVLKWSDGDEIIVSPVGFPTTIAPIAQYNLTPVFADIELDTLNFNVDLVEASITDRTRAIFISPVLGNPPDMDRLIDISKKYNLELLLDGCDSLGSLWDDVDLSNYAIASTCSFYPAHHITTGEGGTVSSDVESIVSTARSIAWWGRDCYCTGASNLLPKGTCGRRIDKWLSDVDVDIDHKYVFANMGYNLKPLDLQGSIGIEQLKKIDSIHAARRQNSTTVREVFAKIKGVHIPDHLPKADPSWFGVPVVCDTSELKQRLVKHLEENNIQTRTYFAGNILLHPGYNHLGDWTQYPESNKVLQRVFFVGCSPTYTPGMLRHIKNTVGQLA